MFVGIKSLVVNLDENMFSVFNVLMGTFYLYLFLFPVPVVALLGDFIYQGLQRWFFPYDHQIIQEIHRNDPEVRSRSEFLEIGTKMTPEEARSFAICQLPRESSKHMH
ncbi:hypothetical protein MRB53_017638 [Persea americana]|uniref:Uncharacterized protein n=1 Tax=Persea americana TaxID=3435 RepID=A0ACC2M5J2_PERAE|nr:hypothetical protein MRB53_017638 [Persea americana]